MEQHITTSPSSNTWVKFEDSDEVTKLTRDCQSGSCSGLQLPSYSCSPLSTDVRSENVKRHSMESDSPTLVPQSVAFKAQIKDSKSYSTNYSRYSAFDCLRFGVDKSNQFGWSRYLLGKKTKAEDAHLHPWEF